MSIERDLVVEYLHYNGAHRSLLTDDQSWELYCLADGYGRRTSVELRTINGGWDWSHIRDSSDTAIQEIAAKLQAMGFGASGRLKAKPGSPFDPLAGRYALILNFTIFQGPPRPHVPFAVGYKRPTADAGSREDFGPAWARARGVKMILQTFDHTPTLAEIGALTRHDRYIEVLEDIYDARWASQIKGLDVLEPGDGNALKARIGDRRLIEHGPVGYWTEADTPEIA